MQWLAYLIAVLIPLGYVIILVRFNIYQTNQQWMQLAAAVAALAGFCVAYVGNTAAFGILPRQVVVGGTAPVLEEILKGAILLVLVSLPLFTYFVDGAIYGFTAGIAFAVIENIYYINSNPGTAVGLAIARVISTNLMHASASGLVGIGFGKARFEKGIKRWGSIVGFWLLAMALHIAFNNMVSLVKTGWIVVFAAILAGLAALAILWFIRQGLKEEKAWIQETLGEADRITDGEAAVVNRMEKLNQILAPIGKRFGKRKQEKCEKFLIKQAQLGIFRKMMEKLPEENTQQALQKNILRLQGEIETLRKEVGAYAMVFLRSVYPPEESRLWDRLEGLIRARIQNQPEGADIRQLEHLIQQKLAAQTGTGSVNVFSALGNRLKEKDREAKPGV